MYGTYELFSSSYQFFHPQQRRAYDNILHTKKNIFHISNLAHDGKDDGDSKEGNFLCLAIRTRSMVMEVILQNDFNFQILTMI
jgi:hypothetical protein